MCTAKSISLGFNAGFGCLLTLPHPIWQNLRRFQVDLLGAHHVMKSEMCVAANIRVTCHRPLHKGAAFLDHGFVRGRVAWLTKTTSATRRCTRADATVCGQFLPECAQRAGSGGPPSNYSPILNLGGQAFDLGGQNFFIQLIWGSKFVHSVDLGGGRANSTLLALTVTVWLYPTI